MLCTNCGKNQATVHIKRTINGVTKEYMLCQECAAKSEFTSSFSDFDSLLKSAFSFAPRNIQTKRKACPSCGSTLSSISDSGKLGCAQCYEVFAEELKPTIARMHANAVYVTGGSIPHNEKKEENKLEKLKLQLSKAVQEENYELAAKLRDEIRELEGK